MTRERGGIPLVKDLPDMSFWVDYHPESFRFYPEGGVASHEWPVALAEIRSVRDTVVERLVELIREYDPDKSESALCLWLVLPDLVGECVENFVAQALVCRLAERNLKPRWGVGEGKWAALAEGKRLPPSRMMRRALRGYPITPLWRRPFRIVWAPVARDGLSRWPIRFADRSRDVFTFSGGPLISAAALADERRVILAKLAEWFPAGENWASAPCLRHGAVAGDAVELFCRAYEDAGLVVAPVLKCHLRETIEGLMAVAAQFLSLARQRAARAPLEFWAGTLGHLGNRAVSRAVAERGGKTVVFDHGTGSGWWTLPIRTVVEFDLADDMITFTSAQAEGTARSIDRRFLVRSHHPCRVEPISQESSVTFVERDSRKSRRSRHRPTAMYVTTVVNGERAEFEPLPSGISLVDWQSRLFERLIGWGYDVIIKPHPSSTAPIPKAMVSCAGINVCTEPMEDILYLADVLIFDWPQSTAFRNAMRTDMPIVYVDFGQISIAPEARPLLDRRVARVVGTVDEYNRLRVDWPSLRAALDKAGRLREPAFVAAYFGG